jgi:hypothetical protein
MSWVGENGWEKQTWHYWVADSRLQAMDRLTILRMLYNAGPSSLLPAMPSFLP